MAKDQELEKKESHDTMIDLERQIAEQNGKYEELVHDFKHEHAHLRIAKAHIESLVKVTT